ncbi:MAG: CehA/McbA family metallohydrolase [Syntrophales bacterium]|nr:CehA/McbA family metallohydrolase [Syntrophales bacterium]
MYVKVTSMSWAARIFFFLVICHVATNVYGFDGLSVFRYYFGSLHNHSTHSDGMSAPDDAFNYARKKGQLHFFALTDHANMISPHKWSVVKELAKRHSQNGLFVALHGFEWSHPRYGHVVVIGTEDYCTESEARMNEFKGFLSWLKEKKGIAFFAHPGERNRAGKEFNLFVDAPIEEMVGMELWNKTRGFDVFYYNDGYYRNDGGKGFFDEALVRGWRLGAGGGEDNHGRNFGTKTNYRVVVLASTLSKESITSALRERRFYTSSDKNLRLFFAIQGQVMGSVIRPGYHNVLVQAADDDGEFFTKLELVKNGQVVKTWRIKEKRPTYTCKLDFQIGDYLYLRVKQADGGEAISSPIFVRQ